jgi:hypothetical protein
MADKKISQLASLLYAGLTDTDKIVILDSTNVVTKSITVAELKLKWQAYSDAAISVEATRADGQSIINALIFG